MELIEVRTKEFQVIKAEKLPELKIQNPELYRKILEKNRDINTDGEFWHEYTVDAFKTALEIFGLSDIKVEFSGFWSQGDGLNFTGTHSYQKNWLRKYNDEFPTDYLNILPEFKIISAIQKKYFYRIYGKIEKNSNWRYAHENTVSAEFSNSNKSTYADYSKQEISDFDTMEEAFKNIMRKFYRTLEKDYYALQEESAIIETLIANEYEFDVFTGKIY